MLTTLLASLLLLAQPVTTPADASATDWKQAVLETAGNDVWPSVTRLRFTFNVTFPDGRSVSRAHDWNLAEGTATVEVEGEPVTIRPWAFEAEAAGEREMAAYRAWVNDGYWLLMPLKLDDPGVSFSPAVMTRDMPPSRARVTMSFDDGTGLTPNDRYDLAIDLRRGVVDQWTYRPNDETAVTWTWEGYEDFNGLFLATRHEPVDNPAPTITFTDVSVERE